MEEITSSKNPLLKKVKKLSKKKYRTEMGLYLIEGEHLVAEALKYQNQDVKTIFFNQSGYRHLAYLAETASERNIYLLTDEAFQSISTVPTPQGVSALVALPTLNSGTTLTGPLLLLDNVQDPGNVGTMIRTADAANYAGLILGEGCADVYSPKVIRSMQGSHFHLPIYEGDLLNIIPTLQKQGTIIYGTELNPAAVDYRTLSEETNFAIVMGNEGQGVRQEILKMVDQTVYIPILGQAESLNVAVAAGILMFSLSH